MKASTVNTWGRWLDDFRNYVALWVYTAGVAVLAGHQPGYWWDALTPWPYPWRETALTLTLVTLEILALRAWLGPRSRRTAVFRWIAASVVFTGISAFDILNRVTDQPGWYYARSSFAVFITVGLLGRTVGEVVRWFRMRRRRTASQHIESNTV